MNKAVSISVFTVIYILGVSFVQNAFRNGHDVGTGILYLYSTLLYVISFIISFSIFGGNKKRKYIFLATSSLSLLYYIYLWMQQSNMPYERIFYILWGISIYVSEFIYLKQQKS